MYLLPNRMEKGIENVYFLCFYVLHVKSIMCVSRSLSHVSLFETPWTVAHQAPLSMGLTRKQYWSGLPCPSLGDLSDPRIEPGSPALQVDSLPADLPWREIAACPPSPIADHPSALPSPNSSPSSSQ